MEIIICKDKTQADALAADYIASAVSKNPKIVLGLATGSTPLGVYGNLIEKNKRGEISFAQASSFNLDEYCGLPATDENSYAYFMRDNLFNHIDIDINNTHIPNGMAADFKEACESYERSIKEAGGVEIQILGIGGDGHIAFNEPSCSLTSRTRREALTRQTIEDNARFFGGDLNAVPKSALTMGIGTIMESRNIVLLAYGENKADAVAAMVEGGISAMCPASILQMHNSVKVFLDEAAASKLKLADYYKFKAEANF